MPDCISNRINIRRRFMSARTVGRAIDEGGKYGEIQLGREIMDAKGTDNFFRSQLPSS
jgi:hypothetical protein